MKINAANAAAFSHRAANAIAAVHIAPIRFAMDAMLGQQVTQLKVPRPDAYGFADSQALFDAHQDSVQNLCVGAYSAAQLAVWFEGRSPEIYRPAIEAHQIWLAVRHGRVLGFVGFAPGEVTLLFVRKEAAGLGLGKRLFALGLAKAASGFSGPLTVIATQNSQRFYQDQGFLPVEEETFIRGEAEIQFQVVKMQRFMAVTS